MSQSISASEIVKIVPGVLSAGGTALDLNGVLLTNNARCPIGMALEFTNPADVSTYFGPSSIEYAAAQIYFLGYDNSNAQPGMVIIVGYNQTAVSAYLRGANVSGLTLTQLQAVIGTLTVTIDGVVKTGTVNLATATSFSNAATLIGTAISAAVTFDSIAGAFVVTSGTVGAASSVGFATGAAAVPLALTLTLGAVQSLGAVAAVPGPTMDSIRAYTTNWAGVTYLFEPVDSDKLLFSNWINSQDNNYLLAAWDSNQAPAAANSVPSSFGAMVLASTNSGTVPMFQDWRDAVFLLGAIASLDFGQFNGRATMAFRTQSGLSPTVTSGTVKANLLANGYNFYGRFATANQQFNFLYDGHISGPFLWIDSYVCQIWMSNQFQLALMTLLVSSGTIPYNAEGYTMIEAACQDVIQAALNFGAIRAGVTLSNEQAIQINNSAGGNVAGTVQTRGWYLLVQDAAPQVRAARKTPPLKFFYTDGQSVQQLTLPTVQVQ